MKGLKKAIGILLCGAMVFGGCGGAAGSSAEAESSSTGAASVTSAASSAGETKGSSESAGNEKLTFEYFTLSMGIEWIQQIDDALKELGEEYNFEVLTGDADYDINEQLSQVDTAIGQGIDGAFLFVVDEGSATAVVEKFDNAGIPVIGETLKLQDENGNNIAPYVELDAESVGGECGKWVCENYEDCGVDLSDMSKVGVITISSSKYQSDLGRGNGFLTELKAGLPDIPETNYYEADIASETNDDESQNAYNLVSPLLATHPEIETWIMVATTDHFGVGACRAVEAAGMENNTILVSCGGEFAVKEWDNEAGACWKAACYYDAMDFVEIMVKGMLEICRDGKDASEIYEEYRNGDETYAAVGISGSMITADDYKEHVRAYQN